MSFFLPKRRRAVRLSTLLLGALAGLALSALSGAALAEDSAEPPSSSAARVITWNLVDWPPFYLLNDGRVPTRVEELGDGVVDGFLRRVLQRLPQYEHRFVLLTGPRAELERKAGLGLCSASSMRTPERLQERYFTPAMPTVQQHLVMQRARAAALGLDAARGVSLRKLLRQTPPLEGVLLSKRHYGAELESLLLHSSHVRSIVAPKAGNLLSMLEAGRMDFTLEYPMVLAHQQGQQRPGREALLVSLPIVEAGEPPLGYFSCNRNAWGQAVITDLDRALREVAAQPEVARLYDRWLTPSQAARERLRMQRFFAARARGGVKIE